MKLKEEDLNQEVKMEKYILEFGFKNYEQFKKLREFFNYDLEKLWLWFYTTNPSLGESSPCQLIYKGREEKLIKFIESALNESELEDKCIDL